MGSLSRLNRWQHLLSPEGGRGGLLHPSWELVPQTRGLKAEGSGSHCTFKKEAEVTQQPESKVLHQHHLVS